MTCLIDLIGISHKLWKQWLAGHIDVTELPPVKFGPWIQYKDLNRLDEAWAIEAVAKVIGAKKASAFWGLNKIE